MLAQPPLVIADFECGKRNFEKKAEKCKRLKNMKGFCCRRCCLFFFCFLFFFLFGKIMVLFQYLNETGLC